MIGRSVRGAEGILSGRSMRMAWILPAGVGLALRLIGLSSRPLWYDEAFAVLFSAKGPSAMLYGTLSQQGGVAADVHPIFYYTLLWLWQSLFGDSPVAVRGLSVLLGLGVVILGFVVARRLFGERTAWVAGILLACAPFQVHYAQEARMYALLALALLGATLAVWRALERGRAVDWVLFGGLAAAAQYAHNLAFVYLVPLSLTPVLMRRWRSALALGGAGLLALALYAPWLASLPSQLARIEWAYWIPRPGATELVRTGLQFIAGLPVPEWSLPVVLACAVFVLATSMLATVRAIRRKDAQGWRAAWLAYLALAPAGVLFLVSQWRPVYLDRALLPSGAVLLVWLAWSLTSRHLDRPLAVSAALALGLAFGLGLFGFYSYSGFPYAPFASVNAQIRESMEWGDVILHSNKITALPGAYYGADLDHRYLADPPGSASDTLAAPTQEVLGLLAAQDVEQAVGDAPGVWFIIFLRELEDYRAGGVLAHPGLAALNADFRLDAVQRFGEVVVYRFRR